MECKCCKGLCIKKGCQNRRQKYYCKACRLYQQKTYTYRICTPEDDRNIIKLNNIGVGINRIAHFTGISKANVVRKIDHLAKKVRKPVIAESGQEYEVDEMHTFIKSKNHPCYIVYAINKRTKQVIDFTIGPRTKENISKVISTLLNLNPKKIFTDKLNVYPGLIEKNLHSTTLYKTNNIERFNLTLRTHLKRLSRKTICFSKSVNMLENCLTLYLLNAV